MARAEATDDRVLRLRGLFILCISIVFSIVMDRMRNNALLRNREIFDFIICSKTMMLNALLQRHPDDTNSWKSRALRGIEIGNEKQTLLLALAIRNFYRRVDMPLRVMKDEYKSRRELISISQYAPGRVVDLSVIIGMCLLTESESVWLSNDDTNPYILSVFVES